MTKSTSDFIPVNEPVIGAAERRYVLDCLDSGWISSSGTYIERFETAWAAYCGCAHGIAVTNGTSALELAVSCLDPQPGDEVILPSFTIVSCALAVVRCGATPILVDVDPETWCLDPGQVAARCGPRTRAIMPVHMYGHPADMDAIVAAARACGAVVLEDAAEAHGAAYLSTSAAARGASEEGSRGGRPASWRRCGGLGDLACFSFYANKLITTGEGGMVVTHDDDLAARARLRRNLCFRQPRFVHDELGYNFRMTNVQAALGLGQVERIDAIVARKRFVGQRYARELADIPGLRLAPEAPWARSVYWMYGIVLAPELGLTAAQLASGLAERGIQTRPFFAGMHEQPVFRRMGLFAGESYPVTEHLSRSGLYLPSGVALTDSQQTRVIAAVREMCV